MNTLPRPATSGHYSRIESSLSNPLAGAKGFHDCYNNHSLTNLRDLKDPGAVIKMSNQGSSALHICIMAKEDIVQNKDSKFAAGMQVTCPYLFCNFKNSQFQSAGRFPSEFLLNHLHSNHKHRRFNGDNLDLTMVVPQVEVVQEFKRSSTKIDLQLNGTPSINENGHGERDPSSDRRERRSERGSVMGNHGHQSQPMTSQTWPFVEIFAHKRYFYLEAQSFTLDGHPEIFLWVWFLGSEAEELHYRYALTVIHGKSEYSYKGPVISMQKSCQDIKNEGRCLVIREKVWDYMSYKLKITRH